MPPVAPMQTAELRDRVRKALPDDLGQLVALASKGVAPLPQTSKRAVNDAIFRYLIEHGIPDEHARTYWTTDKAADDLIRVFDAVVKDLADLGSLGTTTEKALDSLESNLWYRYTDTLREKILPKPIIAPGNDGKRD